jgi:hypothetical protein
MSNSPLPENGAQLLKVRELNKSKKHSDLRDREYLLESKVTAMMPTAKKGRWEHRDSTLIFKD